MSGAVAVRRYICRACRQIHAAWSARCPSCNSLEGFDREPVPANDSVPDAAGIDPSPDSPPAKEPSRPRLVIARAPSPDPDLEDPAEELADVVDDDDLVPLSEVAETTFVRDSTGLPPLDLVLGGGLVVASVVLLASPPGIGKTSLTLQMLDGLGHRCLYVTGEETKVQVAETARRIGVGASRKIYPLAERDLDKIFAKARKIRAQTIAIDSIQKMQCDEVSGRPGSPGQLKACTDRFVDFAKTTGTTLWLIGHVTSDGDVAGPKTIEHDVDVVLELESGAKFEGNERRLRCSTKNRFGATNVVGRFELTAQGFVPIDADGWDEEL